MTKKYSKAVFEDTVMINLVIGDESRWIPTDLDNTDYQVFLAWCEEGNEPDEWSAD